MGWNAIKHNQPTNQPNLLQFSNKSMILVLLQSVILFVSLSTLYSTLNIYTQRQIIVIKF